MLIYNNGFLTLDYDPSTDILSVSLPPVEEIHLSEISKSFNIIVEQARNYDIKRLLFDARETQGAVNEEELAPVISAFAQSLSSTRVRRIARVSSPSPNREYTVEQVFRDKKVQFQSFTEVAPAIAWLLQKEKAGS